MSRKEKIVNGRSRTRIGTRPWSLAVVLLSLLASAPCALAQTYTVALNHAPPYRIVEGEGKNLSISGFYVDIAREAARRAGVQLRYQVVPFKRALLLLERGNADLMLGPNRTPEREIYLDYLDVVISRERKVFLLREGTPDIKHYGDLGGRRIAVLRGAAYFDRFDNDATLNKFDVSDYETGFRVLRGGRVDALIIPELQGDYLLKGMGQSFPRSTLGIPGRASFFALSRKSRVQQSRQALVDALHAMVADGSLARIVEQYR